MNFFLIIKLV